MISSIRSGVSGVVQSAAAIQAGAAVRSAMNGIFVESNELIQAAARTGAIIGSIENIRRMITSVQNRQTNTWMGRASSQNTANFTALDNITLRYVGDATRTRAALDEAVSAYNTQEQTQTANIRQLNTSNIF